MSTKKIASLCVIKNKSKFLLLKRINEPNIGKYVPVGGKLKDHETPKKAAKREIFEETGLKFNKLEFCGVLTETSPKEEYLSATISLKGFVILSPVPPSSKNFSINSKGLVSKSKIS